MGRKEITSGTCPGGLLAVTGVISVLDLEIELLFQPCNTRLTVPNYTKHSFAWEALIFNFCCPGSPRLLPRRIAASW